MKSLSVVEMDMVTGLQMMTNIDWEVDDGVWEAFGLRWPLWHEQPEEVYDYIAFLWWAALTGVRLPVVGGADGRGAMRLITLICDKIQSWIEELERWRA